MSANRFSISWIYHEFKVVYYRLDKVVGTWTAPIDVMDVDILILALTEAWIDLDIDDGGDAYVLFEDETFIHEYIETPNLPKRDLKKFLSRKVESIKNFEGDSSWLYTNAKHNENSSGVLLNIIPKSFVFSLIEIFENFNIKPKRLVALSDLISQHIRQHPRESKISLHIAIFEHSSQLLLMRNDGSVLFVRNLTSDFKVNKTKRLINEIKRTVGYAKQRVGANVDDLIFYGENIQEVLDHFKHEGQMQVTFMTAADAEYYWAFKTYELSPKLSHNFISRFARTSLTHKNLLKTALVIGAVTASCLYLLAIFVEIYWLNMAHRTETLQLELTQIHEETDDFNRQLKELENSRERLVQLNTTSDNLPAVFFSYLGNVLPSEATLLEASVQRQDYGWEVDLKGSSDLALIDMPSVLTRLEHTLVNEPWNMMVTHSWEESWMSQLRSGGAANSTVFGFQLTGQLK